MSLQAQVIDHTTEVMAVIKADTIEKLGKAARLVQKTAREEVPVRTGALRRSIRVKINRADMSAQVIAGNRKAWYVHIVEYSEGRERFWKGKGLKRKGKRSTGVMPKNDFLGRALEKNMAALRDMFSKPIPGKGDK